MKQPLKWLSDGADTHWSVLADAARDGLPVPRAFICGPGTPEEDVRAAYDEIRLKDRTHFVAVRGPSHSTLDVLGPDQMVHAMRRHWTESPDAELLVQRMVNASWCGKAKPDGSLIRISANEGLRLFDPDIYVWDTSSSLCVETTIQPTQRKTIRWIDGTLKSYTREGERHRLEADQLVEIAELASRAGGEITWALDDKQVWLISRTVGGEG